jgi:hypothetical protein
MAHTCIICGRAAGSREHIFPAALGGRRTNKGIYCGDHNEGFSPLAAVMTEQLRSINALLAVRHDRKRRAEAFEYISPEGETLTIFDGKVTRAAPAADATEPMHIQLVIGAVEGLKAVGYVALTFFAHHFQEHARKPGLDPFKDYIRGLKQADFVWWEAENVLAAVHNAFDFGHTIVLTTSATSGEATALVSLFGAFNFGIAFGKLNGLTDETVTVFIDPQAEHPPDDIRVMQIKAVQNVAAKPVPHTKNLAGLVANGGGQRLVKTLYEKIERWQFGKENETFLAQLNALQLDAPAKRKVKIALLLQEQIGVVHAVIKHDAEVLLTARTGKTDFDRMAPHIQDMMVYNEPPAASFTPLGQAVVLKVLDEMADEANTLLAHGVVNADRLWDMLRGAPACMRVGKIIIGYATKAAGK